MASYRRAVAYIALNDEPRILSAEDMAGYASVHAIAEAFDKSEQQVAQDVIKYRVKDAKENDPVPTTFAAKGCGCPVNSDCIHDVPSVQ